MTHVFDNVHCDHRGFSPQIEKDEATSQDHSSDRSSPQWRQLYEIADDVILPALGSPALNHALEKLLDLVGEIADNAEAKSRHQRAGPGRV